MDEQLLVNRLQETFKEDCTGHDFEHMKRVHHLAMYLQSQEGGDIELISLASWLHDLDDHKFVTKNEAETKTNARKLMKELNINDDIIEKVCAIISCVSFSAHQAPVSLEAKIVQDADRLDAMGAIGIARAFAYGASIQRPIYSQTNPQNTLQHFDDKLLKLKDFMHTKTAKQIAEKRHQRLEEFVDHFKEEWSFK